MIKIVHISDIHFGASLKGSSYASELAVLRQHEIKETFFNAVKYASDNADFLIIAGDLFETEYMKKSDVDSVYKAFSLCNANILIITGNHDPLKQNSFWQVRELPKNVFLFSDEHSMFSFEEYDLDVYGHSWNTYYLDEDQLSSISIKNKNKINILIGHGDIYLKKTQYMPIDKKSLLEKGFDYIALGHIHKPDIIDDKIVYPGSLEPFDFKETGKHGLVEVVLNKDKSSISFKPFSKREFKLVTVEVTPELTYDDIINRIRLCDTEQERNKNLYRFILTGKYNTNIQLKKYEIMDIIKHDFFYVELKQEARMEYDIPSLLHENKDNIIGKYIEYFNSLPNIDDITQKAFEVGLEKLLSSKEGQL